MRDLADERYINLATFRKNGVAVPTPVWCVGIDGKLFAFTLRESGKVKRLRNVSRARVAPCDVRGRLRGEWIEAIARIVDDDKTEERVYTALRSKYGWTMRAADFFSTLTGRMSRRVVLEIEV